MPDFNSLVPGAGIVFDMDGLMLDTERISKIAWQKTARLGGYEMSDALFESMIGRREPDSIEILHGAFGSEFDFARANAQVHIFYQEFLAEHGLPLKPGVHELLAELVRRGIPLGVATSTQNPTAPLRLAQAGLAGYFSVLIAGDEIENGKPEPDIYLEAIQRLEIDPLNSFALEDSPAGVRAAHAAGLNVIMVPDIIQPTPEISALTWRLAKSLLEVRGWLYAPSA